MKTTGKRLLSLLLCLVMVLTLLPTVAFAEDAIPITAIEATSSEFVPPVYGAANTYNCHFEVTNGAQVSIPYKLANWMKVTETGGLEDYTDSTFTEGTYQFVCHVRTDGTAYTFTEDTTVKVNGVSWTSMHGNLGTVIEYFNGNRTCYYNLTYSPYFEVKKSGTLIKDLPITAAWDASCQTISSYSAAQAGFTVSKVEMVKDGEVITKATPGDTIYVAFIVRLDPGYTFASDCHAYWNGEQETAKITGSADNEKGFAFKVTVPTPVTEPVTEVVTIPIFASWNDTCQYISSCSTTELGCRITKVEMVKNGTAITKATPGDTITVAFTVELSLGYGFSSNCHAYWNGAQETAKIVGSADYEKRFAFKVTVPTPGIEPTVEAVTITDIDKPVIGQHPDTTFRIMSANELGLTGSATWYEYKNGVGGPMSTDDVFREGYTYGCSISIAALNRTFRYTTETDDYGDEYDVFDGTLTVNGTASTGYVSMSATRLSTRWWSGAALPADCGGDPAVCPGAVFTDMPAYGNWAHNPIDWAVQNSITSGTSSTKFSPNKTCTRGQIVTFLWRAAGKPTPKTTTCSFTDVKDTDYFYKAVLWAVEEGITKGTSATTFGPNKDCTRGEIVTFLWRAMGEPKPSNTNHSFTDIKPNAYYYTAVLWAVEKGVTSGTSKTAFSPNESCTRAQAVTFLYRAFN